MGRLRSRDFRPKNSVMGQVMIPKPGEELRLPSTNLVLGPTDLLGLDSEHGLEGILAEIVEFVMGKELIPTDGEIWGVRRHAVVPTLHQKAGWKLWPFAHLITYGVIPVEQRLLWVDCVELIWVTILSTYSNEKSEAEADSSSPSIGPPEVEK
ncbi:hypothetical protein RHGRI_011178 [Rhododendron griersonianum]|uniref:Uncharacterized protein n=1 Tax=Rhododendron griersonianum TaxID=479676 RepID=A0AAV6KKT6_9ERIC|nr:hypothetical protein RHGRI_011178 [Rhododendron griersonianum]